MGYASALRPKIKGSGSVVRIGADTEEDKEEEDDGGIAITSPFGRVRGRGGRVAENTVVSMGRRNTQLRPTFIENTKAKSAGKG